MWLNVEISGMICGTLTYFIVLAVEYGMIRIGLWEGLQEGKWTSYLNLLVFQYHCAMIFWSHIKCMTTEPGVLPFDYEELDFAKMSAELRNAIVGVQNELKQLELQ